MAKAIDHLMQKGFDVVVTASSDAKEMARVKDILSLVKGNPIDLSGRTTLKQLAAISEMSELFIGVDSAPMHIAAAVNVPVVGLFGPSSETLWAPWCEKHLVISKDMACRLPCKNKRGCRTYECMNEITLEELIARVDHFIDETVFSNPLSR
jgi:heptosyltransferase-3